MKFKLLFSLFVLAVTFSQAQEKTKERSPLETVNLRMDLYNQHDFEGFIALYAPDIKVYTYPDKLLGDDLENIASIFKPKFEAKSLSIEILNQMENGKHVINHEIVTENGKQTKYVSIYEVENGLIQSVRFVRDY